MWEKFGYEKAYARLIQEEGKKSNHKKSVPTLENVIGGKLDYLRMVKGEKDKVYIKYASLFDKLKEQKKHFGEGISYIVTYSVEDFQQLFHTELQFVINSGALRASFKLYDVFYPVRMTSASRRAILNNSKEVVALNISLCKDDSLFWLIHIRKPTASQKLEITLPIKKIIEIWRKKGLNAAMDAEATNKAAQKK